MARSIVVFGTSHALQGAANYPGKSVSSPGYSRLIQQLVKNRGIDCIFEEASGKGPTIASNLAGSIPYLDVDASRENPGEPVFKAETGSLGIPIDPGDSSMSDDFYAWEFVKAQNMRENIWLQRIETQHFGSGLMICGYLHLLSFASKLMHAKFDVNSLYYMPHHRLCRHKIPTSA